MPVCPRCSQTIIVVKLPFDGNPDRFVYESHLIPSDGGYVMCPQSGCVYLEAPSV